MPGWTGCDVCQRVAKLIPVALLIAGAGWLVRARWGRRAEPDVNGRPIP